MTLPRHHPSAELLVDIARGAANAGRSLVTQAHLAVCPECRRMLATAEVVGGAFLEELPPSLMSPDALARTLARLGNVEPPQPVTSPAAPAGWVPAPAPAIDALARRRWAAPGVWTASIRLDPAPDGRVYLLGVGAGMTMPSHTHRGLESLCVLKGAFEDRGEVYGPGDFVESDETVVHRPAITRSGACVCLAWTENPLVPRSIVGWLMQPIVGI